MCKFYNLSYYKSQNCKHLTCQLLKTEFSLYFLQTNHILHLSCRPFLNSNAVIPHAAHPQGSHMPGAPVPVVPYQTMPYMPRPVPTPVPLAYRSGHPPPMPGPVRVPNFYHHHHPQQQQPQQPLKRTAEEVLDLSAKKSKLDPNGNVIGTGGVRLKPQPGSPTNERLEDSNTVPHPMITWGVEKVADFVGAVPGCQDYVEVGISSVAYL